MNTLNVIHSAKIYEPNMDRIAVEIGDPCPARECKAVLCPCITRNNLSEQIAECVV